jgi:hypothetical protein
MKKTTTTAMRATTTTKVDVGTRMTKTTATKERTGENAMAREEVEKATETIRETARTPQGTDTHPVVVRNGATPGLTSARIMPSEGTLQADTGATSRTTRLTRNRTPSRWALGPRLSPQDSTLYLAVNGQQPRWTLQLIHLQ